VRYWICVTTQANWEVVRKHNVWGVSDRFRGTIERVRPGDRLIFYVMQTKMDKEVIPSRIVGIFEATSEVYKDSTPIFKAYKGTHSFPNRVRLKPIKIAEKPVFFKELVPKLSFIKNKQRWSGYLRRAMVEIPKEDYELIERALG